MNLTEEQKAAIASWVQSGADLVNIQERLKEKFELSLTYLDTRFLLGDLGLEIEEESDDQENEVNSDVLEVSPEKIDSSAKIGPEESGDSSAAADSAEKHTSIDEAGGKEPETSSGNATVTVDSLTQPQCIISVKVTFSDGKGAAWHLDQMGRLGFNPEEEGYSPSQEDAAVFEKELRNVLRKQGL